MMEIYKIYSNSKIKTFSDEAELIKFANEMNVLDYLIIKLNWSDEYENIVDIRIKADGKFKVRGYLEIGEKNGERQAGWLEDVDYPWYYDREDGFKTVNEALKSFISWKETKANNGDESQRYTVWDVYSPAELGLVIKG